MLEKIFYLDYHNRGSSESEADYSIATDCLKLDFMQMSSFKSSSRSSLEFTYFNALNDFEGVCLAEDTILKDQLFVRSNDFLQIILAERRLFGANGKKVTFVNFPTGIYVYNYEDIEEWIRNGRPDFIALDTQAHSTLVENTNRALAEFKNKFYATLKL